MPRVPLCKLKDNANQEVTNNEPISHVETIARRIKDAKLGTQPRNIQQVEPENGQVQRKEENIPKLKKPQEHMETRRKRRCKPRKHAKQRDATEYDTDAVMDKRKAPLKVSRHHKKQRNIPNIDLRKHEVQNLREIEDRLRKTLHRKSLRFVLIDSESSEEMEEESSSYSSSSGSVFSVTNIGERFVGPPDQETEESETGAESPCVAVVDVHHEPDLHEVDSSGTDGQLEGAVGYAVKELPSARKAKGGHLNEGTEVFLAEEGALLSNSSLEGFGSQHIFKDKKNPEDFEISVAQKRKNSQLEMFDQKEIQWGQEESSDTDSEGGWDFETGGMPLLPR